MQGLPVTGIIETQVLLADPHINESSGLARSIKHPGIFWTLNDSGGEPCVLAIDESGKSRAKVRLRDAANLDWEDLAIGPGPDGNPCLFVADVGDNLGLRPSIQIYRFPEPDIPDPTEDSPAETWSEHPRVLHAAYPDHPHNAEGLAVHPEWGQIILVTKSDTGLTHLFSLPTNTDSDSTSLLNPLTHLTFPSEARLGKRPRDNTMATAADISPDGQRFLISTYSHIYEWNISSFDHLAIDLAQPPAKIAPTVTRQMEAVCYAEDSLTIWFTSEQLPAPLIRIQRDPNP